jgi:hypothetical protein
MERNSFRGTFKAFETCDTVLLAIRFGNLFRNGSDRTTLHTLLAMGAILSDNPLQYSKA